MPLIEKYFRFVDIHTRCILLTEKHEIRLQIEVVEHENNLRMMAGSFYQYPKYFHSTPG